MISPICESNSLMISSGEADTIEEGKVLKILEFNNNFIDEKVNFLNY